MYGDGAGLNSRLLQIRGNRALGSFGPVSRLYLPFLALFLLAGRDFVSGFTSVVAFGDSYTDVGNLPSSPPDYWNGRFSNGPLWIEYLAVSQGFAFNGVTDFAVSGSEAEDLGTQIGNYPGTSDSANTLFAIWSGNNDFANHLDLGTSDSAWNQQINYVVSSLKEAIDLLYQKGARNLVLFNQMDLTKTPAIRNHYGSTFQNYLRGKINSLNSNLANVLPNVLSSHPGLQIYYIDIYSDFNYLIANYGYYGFATATIDALDDPNLADTTFGGPGANYVFWDSQHPTTKTHNLISDWVNAALPAVQPPPTLSVNVAGEGPYAAPTTLQLNAVVDPKGWSVGSVDFFANGQTIGTSTNGPYSILWNVSSAGNYAVTARVNYGSGQTVTSDAVSVTVGASQTGSPLPKPWNQADLGAVGQAGSAYYSNDGTYTVLGSGSDIWGTQDAFHFVYQTFIGDGSIVAKLTGIQNTDGYAKACVMIRASLDPGSANAAEIFTPSAGPGFQARTVADGETTYTPGAGGAVPYWIKLERSGDVFRGYSSVDGSTWTLTDTATVPMSGTLMAGLGVTAHNDSVLNTSMFASVWVGSGMDTPPRLSIGRTNGLVQITLTGTAGATYELDASADLSAWTPISTNATSHSSTQITDPQSNTLARRFYRAVLVR